MKIFVCQGLNFKNKEHVLDTERRVLQTLVNDNIINPSKYDIVHNQDYSENCNQFNHCMLVLNMLHDINFIVFADGWETFAESRVIRLMCEEYGIPYYEL